ncbi:PIN domain-containing protein [Methylacidimicrobium tartarophylax]|nr:PIN domain-containing protein [Methylacidimicrobium tartarophylax]
MMKSKRTYVDASVLIAAFRGEEKVMERALKVVEDPNRTLVVSNYLRLEVLPKPTFHGMQEELEFMKNILDNAADNVSTSDKLTKTALNLASQYDMTPIDALHVAAAVVAKVDELVTMEKPTKPMCRVTDIPVVSIHSDAEATR